MMNFAKLFLSAVGLLLSAGIAFGQETPLDDGPQHNDGRPMAGQPGDLKRDLMGQLGLSPEQMQQIRRMNMTRRPLIRDAQMHLREAMRALDDAIYAEQLNEADVQTRLREFQLAQSEVGKVRFETELAVRKILTPEQLVRFREMRQRFEEERRRLKRGDRQGGDNPMYPGRRRNRMGQGEGMPSQRPEPSTPPNR